jgi:P27 family predicted phage terminase small subunit
MKPGRPPLPTAIKAARGTLRKSQVVPNEMTVQLISDVPEPPHDLTDDAKKTWRNVCEELKRNGLLATVDLELVKAYCNELAMYNEAVKQINENSVLILSPNGYPMINPWQTIRKQSLKAAMDLGQLFGLTPSARTRIPSSINKTESKLKQFQKSKSA